MWELREFRLYLLSPTEIKEIIFFFEKNNLLCASACARGQDEKKEQNMEKPTWASGLPAHLAISARLISTLYFSFQKGTVLHREIPMREYVDIPWHLEEACHHVLVGNQSDASDDWIVLPVAIRRNLTVLARAAFRCWQKDISEWMYARVYGDLSWSPVAIPLSSRDRTLPILHDQGWRKLTGYMRNDSIYRRGGVTQIGDVSKDRLEDLVLRDILMLENHANFTGVSDCQILIMQVARTMSPETLAHLTPVSLEFVEKFMPTLWEKIPKQPVLPRDGVTGVVAQVVKNPVVGALFS